MDADNEIAIVGMACVVPGAKDIQRYWENIVNKVDAIGEPPPEWEADLYYQPGQQADDRIYCKRGGFLGELAAFDPLLYGVMPNAVDGTEPDHFLALRLAQEALLNAVGADGKVPRERTEVIIGRGSYVNRGNTTAIQHGIIVDQVLAILKQLHPEHNEKELTQIRAALKESIPPFNSETAAGLVPNIISGRIANRLDLMGANYIVDAACASSLIAVEMGMRDLLNGHCDMVIAGGIHASTPPPILMIFCQLEAISKTGMIRPFDRRADGTLLGEGGGMIILKRRADAERDGDRIYALIKGIGTASDGKARGLLAPRVEGEALALSRAYQAAGCPLHSIGLLEAHGTGTPTGDEVEIEALTRVFGNRPQEQPRIALGTVKSMISHLMPASGIVALIKTALALHHRVLPPTLGCEEPAPELASDDSVFYLNTETRPWIHPHSRHPRRAGVNAFGFGGINAHAVLEEYLAPDGGETLTLHHGWETELYLLSGKTREALIERAKWLRGMLTPPDFNPKDLAYTLNVVEQQESERLAVVAADLAELDSKLANAIERLGNERCRQIRDVSGIYYFSQPLAREGKLAFVFPGEGSQYSNMLADLCIHFPEVRKFFDFMDDAFVDHPRGYLPSQVIFPPPSAGDGDSGDEDLWSMDSGAEGVFTASQALFRLLCKLEIQPDVMVGHSTGEHSALLASGAVKISSGDQLKQYVLAVNAIFERLSASGSIPDAELLAVGGADMEMLRSLVSNSTEELFIAMDNCPHQVVLCGKSSAISAALEELERNRAICQRLPFERAYHTPWFEVFSKPLKAFFEGVEMVEPGVSLYSCVTGRDSTSDLSELRTLAANSWSAPVLFRETIERMYDDGVRLFVEVGPKASLKGFIDDTLRGRDYAAIASNVSHRSGITQLNHMVGQLMAHGVRFSLEHLYRRRNPVAIELGKPAGDSTAGRKVRPKMHIASGLQPLRLPSDFVLDGAPPPSAKADSGEPAQISRPAETMPVTREAAAPLAPGNRSQGTPAVAVAPADGVGQRLGGRSGPAHATAVQQHFQTMQRFLEVQSQVMRSYANTTSHRGGRPAGALIPDRTESRMGAQARPDLPFIDEILDSLPGQRVRAVRTLRLHQDIFLRDHTLGRDPSDDDPDLLALPVVPLTMSIEILAQGGALLRPGKTLTAVFEIRGYKWITLEQPEKTLEIRAQATARADSDDAVHVLVLEAGQEGDQQPVPLIEGVLVFGEGYPSPPEPAPLDLRDERPSTWTTEKLYRDWMFHGPSFRGVKSMTRSGANGTTARLKVLPRSGLFRGQPSPCFLTEPVLLDAAGQVVAFWATERLERGFDIFPYTLKALHLYSDPPQPETEVECRVATELMGDRQMRSDIDLVASDGTLLYRMVGWEDWRFDMPPEFLKLRMAPRSAELGQPWEQAIGHLPTVPAGVVCSRLDGLSEPFLEAHGAIWRKVLAHLILSRRERDEWQAVVVDPDHRNRWLLGRAAAKAAVRKLVQRNLGLDLCPADIELQADRHGLLMAGGSWSDRLGGSPRVCCSDADGLFAAVTANPDTGFLGFELSAPIPGSMPEDCLLNPHEERLLNALGAEASGEWQRRIQCARGALNRALGAEGTALPARLVELVPDRELVRLSIDGSPIPGDPPLSTIVMDVYTVVHGQCISAVTNIARRR